MKYKANSHRLINRATGKVLNLSVKNNVLHTETGKEDKLRKTEKAFSDKEQVINNFYKKEWEALKKGFVLVNENAKVGTPSLHTYIGGGYTGALTFTSTPKGIMVYKNTTEGDVLVVLDSLGNLLNEIKLPRCLAWTMEYQASSDTIVLDIDHAIYQYNLEKDSFTNLKEDYNDSVSFLSVSEHQIAIGLEESIALVNTSKETVFPISHKGKTVCCGKLSQDGTLLAYHSKVGEIQIFNTADRSIAQVITGDFREVGQMEFVQSNQLLVVRERYGTWGMRYFDLVMNQEIKLKELEIPEYTKDVNAFCFNKDQTKLVLVQRTNAYVFDFINKKELHHFKIEHVIKSCEIKFIGEQLGVRTDYGCFSLYVV